MRTIFKILWGVGAISGGVVTIGFNVKDAFEVGQLGFQPANLTSGTLIGSNRS